MFELVRIVDLDQRDRKWLLTAAFVSSEVEGLAYRICSCERRQMTIYSTTLGVKLTEHRKFRGHGRANTITAMQYSRHSFDPYY